MLSLYMYPSRFAAKILVLDVVEKFGLKGWTSVVIKEFGLPSGHSKKYGCVFESIV
jgi:hypothetical protein